MFGHHSLSIIENLLLKKRTAESESSSNAEQDVRTVRTVIKLFIRFSITFDINQCILFVIHTLDNYIFLVYTLISYIKNILQYKDLFLVYDEF